MSTLRKSAVLITGLIVVASLTACAGQSATPAATLTASAPASPTPTPSPTPALTVITLGSDSAVASDQNGQPLATIDYFSRGVDTAAVLTELFGFEPVVTVTDPIASDAFFQGTSYDWDGFRLDWTGGYESDPASGMATPPYQPSISFTTSVASVRGIAIQGTDGARVGDGQGDLATRYTQTRTFSDPDGVVIETAFADCVTLPPFETPSPDAAGEPMNCVGIRATPSDGPVTEIHAPTALNYGS